MEYGIDEFNKEFPDDNSCLEYVWKKRYNLPDYYRIGSEKAYCDSLGHKIFPLKGTLMEKTRTPLRKWFYAFYLYSQAKNGMSAKELQRHLGVTYKCAYRIGDKIRGLMKENKQFLSGIVEVDEAYVGGRRQQSKGRKNLAIVFGMKERGGKIVATVIPERHNHLLLNPIREIISKDATIISDELAVYMKLPKYGYKHQSVNHSKKEYGRDGINTNSIESYWSYVKRNIRGTFCGSVRKKKLQTYIDFFSFQQNYVSPFRELLERL